MRTISAEQISAAVARLCVEANLHLPADIGEALRACRAREPFAPAQGVLDLLIENADVARETAMPICQDTGMAVVFADVGQDVHISGDFTQAVNEGVRRGYTEGLLRKSVVGDPLRRVNTGDNTPAMLHVRLVPGDQLSLCVAPCSCAQPFPLMHWR